MRTNIDIDERLMGEVLAETGLRTKREAVHEGLRVLLQRRKQAGVRELFGKINWIGDLDEMRRD